MSAAPRDANGRFLKKGSAGYIAAKAAQAQGGGGCSVNINPAAYLSRLEAHLNQNLDRAALHVWRYIVNSFNNFGADGMQAPSMAGHSTKAKDHVPSKEEMTPNVRTGHLKRNVGYDKVPNQLARRIGTAVGNKESVNYAMYLELGTINMAPRPFLQPGVKNNWRIIETYLTRPML